MKILKYKKDLKYPLRPRTITFLLKGNEVLLGYKKRGFGIGNYLGIGGKVEENELIEKAAIREVEEEIHVTLNTIKRSGILYFYFPHILDETWNQEVHVFIADTWKGIPQETEEIKPEWFGKNSIPFKQMWDDAQYWLPEILKGNKIKAEFLFDEKLEVIEYSFL